jgi:hypothetical protein
MFQHLLLQDPSKFTQIAIFGLKISHLATLRHLARRSATKWRNNCMNSRLPLFRPFPDVGEVGKKASAFFSQKKNSHNFLHNYQGCQMVNFSNQKSQFGYIFEGLGIYKYGTYILWPFKIYFGHYFMASQNLIELKLFQTVIFQQESIL